MIDVVVPGTATCESFTDVPDEPLFPEEEAAIARAPQARRAEFRTVRACARQALARLGRERPPQVPGAHGEPRWPAGVVGSMTHCPGYRAVSVAASDGVLAVGIDAEPDAPLPSGVVELAAGPDERAWLDDLAAARPGVAWDRLLFSAKEAVYKAWYPLTGRWLDFEDVAVAFHRAVDVHRAVDGADLEGEFTANLLGPGSRLDGRSLTVLHGRWTASRGLLLTGLVIPR